MWQGGGQGKPSSTVPSRPLPIGGLWPWGRGKDTGVRLPVICYYLRCRVMSDYSYSCARLSLVAQVTTLSNWWLFQP